MPTMGCGIAGPPPAGGASVGDAPASVGAVVGATVGASVGGTGVAVGGIEVAVGGTGVAVGGTCVAAGASVAGTDVAAGAAVGAGAAGAPHPTAIRARRSMSIAIVLVIRVPFKWVWVRMAVSPQNGLYKDSRPQGQPCRQSVNYMSRPRKCKHQLWPSGAMRAVSSPPQDHGHRVLVCMRHAQPPAGDAQSLCARQCLAV